MSTAIEWSLGLPCPDHRDAIVATIVDGGHAPSGAATAEHLRRCPACRAFRDSLRTQRLLLRRVAEEQKEEAEKRARQRRLRADMREWVEEELKVRGERELATALWRCAAAILRLDPVVARCVRHEEGATHLRDPVYAECLDRLQHCVVRSAESSGVERRGQAGVRDRVTRALRVLETADHDSRQVHVEVMRTLLDLAEAVSSSSASVVATTRAGIEWYLADERKVRPLLDRALETSRAPHQRGQAISNLAVWFSAKGAFDDAIALGREAVRVSQVLVFSRTNLAIWTTVVGDLRQADQFLFEAAALTGSDAFRTYWPWTLLRGSLEACLNLTGASVRERRRSVDSLWIAYHRAGGHIPAPSERRSIPDREVSL